jgi:enamine deaminase RidA (YjgF/YER057c/UK114 family)
MARRPSISPKLTVYVASGTAGAHGRSAIGVAALPLLGSPVELDAVVAGSGPP